MTGEVVYANFGLPEDYEALEALGVSVEGKIVLVRYGGSSAASRPSRPSSAAPRA